MQMFLKKIVYIWKICSTYVVLAEEPWILVSLIFNDFSEICDTRNKHITFDDHSWRSFSYI